MKYLFLIFVFCLVLQGAVASNKDYVNVTHVKDTFMATFVHTTPLKDYVIGVSISTLNIQKAFHNITLAVNEAWTDVCLDIVLGNPLPEALQALLPPTFLDLRVFYRVDTAVQNEDAGDIMCPMSMITCPDGTMVGYTVVNGKCALVCPTTSYPSGNVSHAQMVSIKKDFKRAYMLTAPYSDFIIEVGITTLAGIPRNNITLYANEHWSDLCLYVATSPASTDLEFPTVYQGVRVFYYVNIIEDSESFEAFNMSAIIIPVAVFLLVFFFVVGCCMRRRKCRQACKARAALAARAPEEPVATPLMVPVDFGVDMYGQQYGYDFHGEQQEPIMMVPNGYPVFVPQHGWFMPPLQQQQQQE